MRVLAHASTAGRHFSVYSVFGKWLLLLEFLVFSKLAVPAILEGGFCGKFFEAIRPRVKLMELYDGSTYPKEITVDSLDRPHTSVGFKT